MSASRNLLSVFREFPKELFRVNDGFQVKLRAWTPQRRVYDIYVENGLVIPKALNESTYIGRLVSVSLLSNHTDYPLPSAPNGASMRPNSPYQQSLVSGRFRGNNVIVYSIPKGNKGHNKNHRALLCMARRPIVHIAGC